MSVLDDLKSRLNKSKSVLSQSINTASKFRPRDKSADFSTALKTIVDSKTFKSGATKIGTAVEDTFEKAKSGAKNIRQWQVDNLAPKNLSQDKKDKVLRQTGAVDDFILDIGSAYGRTSKRLGEKGGTQFAKDIKKIPEIIKQQGWVKAFASDEFEDATNLLDVVPGAGKTIGFVGAAVPLIKKSGKAADLLKAAGKTDEVIDTIMDIERRIVKSDLPKKADTVTGSIESLVDAVAPADEIADPVKKITDKLTEFTKLRAIRVTDVKADRATKNKLLEEAYQNFQGNELLEEINKIQSGKMDELRFEPLKDITQDDVNSLFKQVTDSGRLTASEKAASIRALDDIMNGKVPDSSRIKYLQEVFPPDFTNKIVELVKEDPKAWEKVAAVLNVPRAMRATLDLSMPLRQGLFMVGHPKAFAKAFVDQFKYAFNEKAYLGLAEDIKAMPTYKLMKENGVEFTDLGDDLSAREEAFVSNLVDKIPGFGALTKGTNRAASGFLNSVRADVFNDFAKRIETLGLSSEQAAKELAAFGDYVNTATGRGKFGNISRHLEKIDNPAVSAITNSVFFSPKLMASRLTLLNPIYYAKLAKNSPEVAKVAVKDFAVVVGGGMSILALAKAAGAEVGTDMRNSDFGKIKIGNTRVDIWGGFQQYVVFLARQMSGGRVDAQGNFKKYGEGYKADTAMRDVGKFARTKLAPIPATFYDIREGENIVGEKTTAGSVAKNLIVPMTLENARELMEDDSNDFGADAFFQMISLFGAGVNTYDSGSKNTSSLTSRSEVKSRSKTVKRSKPVAR